MAKERNQVRRNFWADRASERDIGSVMIAPKMPIALVVSLRAAASAMIVPNVPVEVLRNSFTHLRGDGSRRHYAIDIPAFRGTPILAPEDGTVIQMHTSKQGGITLYATESDQRFIYFFAHLDRYHPRIKEGLAISRGDTIGFVGSTGNAVETGPHLHFAIMMSSNIARWSTGTPLNPFEVYKY